MNWTTVILWALMAPSSLNLAMHPARVVNATAWVTPNDYPPVSIERGEAGTAKVELHVTAEGKVDGCNVQQSTGSPLLDATTCAVIRQRARYEPATDRNGHVTASTDTRTINWAIPNEDRPAPAWIPRPLSFGVRVDVDIDDHGKVVDCRTQKSGKMNVDELGEQLGQLADSMCAEVGSEAMSAPLKDRNGKAVPSRLNVTITADLKQR